MFKKQAGGTAGVPARVPRGTRTLDDEGAALEALGLPATGLERACLRLFD